MKRTLPMVLALVVVAAACADSPAGDGRARAKLETAIGASDQFHFVIAGARQRLALARCLSATNRSAEASTLLSEARVAVAGVGAALYVRKIDEANAPLA